MEYPEETTDLRHQLLAAGQWFPPGTPVSSTKKLISSSSFHRLDMTLAVAEALNPNKPINQKTVIPSDHSFQRNMFVYTRFDHTDTIIPHHTTNKTLLHFIYLLLVFPPPLHGQRRRRNMAKMTAGGYEQIISNRYFGGHMYMRYRNYLTIRS